MMMDHYSKSPAVVTVSEGTSFAQTGKKKKGDKDKPKTTDKDPKEFDKEYWKDKECYRWQEGTSSYSLLCQASQGYGR